MAATQAFADAHVGVYSQESWEVDFGDWEEGYATGTGPDVAGKACTLLHAAELAGRLDEAVEVLEAACRRAGGDLLRALLFDVHELGLDSSLFVRDSAHIVRRKDRTRESVWKAICHLADGGSPFHAAAKQAVWWFVNDCIRTGAGLLAAAHGANRTLELERIVGDELARHTDHKNALEDNCSLGQPCSMRGFITASFANEYEMSVSDLRRSGWCVVPYAGTILATLEDTCAEHDRWRRDAAAKLVALVGEAAAAAWLEADEGETQADRQFGVTHDTASAITLAIRSRAAYFTLAARKRFVVAWVSQQQKAAQYLALVLRPRLRPRIAASVARFALCEPAEAGATRAGQASRA